MKRVVLLGCTGSVGTQTLDVIHRLNERTDDPSQQFSVVGLGAGHWSEALQAQTQRWQPDVVAVAEPTPSANGPNGQHAPVAAAYVELFSGDGSLERMVERLEPD